jgi:hypothetical protein
MKLHLQTSHEKKCQKACRNGDIKLKAATQEEAHRLMAQQNLQAHAFHDLKKRGHNKVSSMLLYYLKSNCPGQNKN